MAIYIHYIIQHKASNLGWYTRRDDRIFARGPKPDDKSVVTLEGKEYFVIPPYDQREIVRHRFRRWKKNLHIHRYFVDGIPTQMPPYSKFGLFKAFREIVDITNDHLSEAGKAHKISEMLHPTMNWTMVFLALLAGLGIGAILSQLISAH